ncbi:hypothetical protein [Bacillus pseudomycoides]|uniref:hypothetical protein n=1 Tax=Bacillus pseudomycoides TaxID=64104 RepID=UPI000BEC3822|nr:hypothetical protein [Bacillus pseudomycoides]PEF26061.1 hypothetical protein CON69_03240 [Bacillus pseudomycoides]PGD75795.1 hypothetical protein COM46_14730 [Bacillus pseudomycoides]
MIKIDRDGEAYWSETVDLGVLGKFNSIFINLDGCDITGATDDMSQEEKIEKATKYYGNRFKELEANVCFINEQFLMWIITHLCDIEYPFWEFGDEDEGSEDYPDYIVKEEIKKFEDENGQLKHDPYSPSPIYKEIQEYNAYNNEGNLSSYEIIAKYLPVLDFKKLVDTIRANSIDTYGDNINFQVSSEVCGGMLLCATYGTIYTNNELEVTHNC